MPLFIVNLCDDYAARDIDADYYVTEGEFTTFKNGDHKQVASFNNRQIVSIVRATAKSTSVGTAHVTIVPTLDRAALEATIAQAQRQMDRALSL